MDASGSHQSNRDYYDTFAHSYEDHRGENDPGGYHELLDELETEFVRRYADGREVLEVGCGTGLVLRRIQTFAKRARGVDLSPGMLQKARERGLDVIEGSATALPFEDQSFDVTCSFKVLAHVPDIQRALSEMVRVTRPGGTVLAEFYNPYSFRGLVKKLGPAGKIGGSADESSVYTRFDSPFALDALLPRGAKIIDARGVRIAMPTARVMRVPLVRDVFRTAERWLCDSPLRVFGGFYVAAIRRQR